MMAARAFTDAQLNAVARQVTAVLCELGIALNMRAADLAAVAAAAAVNVNVSMHGPAGIEHVRNAADAAERQLLDEGAVS
jgi:hypothetical protein